MRLDERGVTVPTKLPNVFLCACVLTAFRHHARPEDCGRGEPKGAIASWEGPPLLQPADAALRGLALPGEGEVSATG